jgi:multiple antibiotic resistance protein
LGFGTVDRPRGTDLPNAFFASLITMVILLEPVSNVPTFLSLTQRQSQRARNRIALIAVVAAAVILGIFAAVGESLLSI